MTAHCCCCLGLRWSPFSLYQLQSFPQCPLTWVAYSSGWATEADQSGPFLRNLEGILSWFRLCFFFLQAEFISGVTRDLCAVLWSGGEEKPGIWKREKWDQWTERSTEGRWMKAESRQLVFQLPLGLETQGPPTCRFWAFPLSSDGPSILRLRGIFVYCKKSPTDPIGPDHK